MGALACTFCRSRKVSCDRNQPACSRCLSTGRPCEYRARKSAKMAAHSRIKAFESRLGSLESQLLQEQSHLHNTKASQSTDTPGEPTSPESSAGSEGPFPRIGTFQKGDWNRNPTTPGESFSPDLHTLPPVPLQQKLYHLYFQKIHPTVPMIHKLRFTQSLEGDPASAPPAALKFAMWATAAQLSSEYQHIAERLYLMGRKHAEDIEMKSDSTKMSPSLAQCWFLLAYYEANQAYFTRAWMSVGRCIRVVQMLNLHRIDSQSPYEKANFRQHAGVIEREEGRRVFWASYCGDKWASTLSGHPLMIKDENIYTNLPCSEKSFELEVDENGVSLQDIDDIETISSLSPFAGSIFTTTILGKCINQRSTYEYDLKPENVSHYWDCHRKLDTTISLTFMNLPAHLRVAQVESDVTVVHSNFNLHLAIIILHRLAIRIADKQNMEDTFKQISFQRCIQSAVEIKDNMYSVRDLKHFPVNMWTTASLYMAGGVFIEDLRRNRPSPNSPADLGLVMIALKEIAALQGTLDFYAQRLEEDIMRAKVSRLIPPHLRQLAGIKVPEARDSKPDENSDTPVGVSGLGVYKYV